MTTHGTTGTDTAGVVRSALVEAIGVEEDEVTPEATLMGDLGAESIDLLDVLFRLERKLGVRIQASTIAYHIQGDVADDDFGDEHGIITETGLRQLRKAMPQVDPDQLRGRFEAQRVMSLFTVQNLTDLCEERLRAS